MSKNSGEQKEEPLAGISLKMACGSILEIHQDLIIFICFFIVFCVIINARSDIHGKSY